MSKRRAMKKEERKAIERMNSTDASEDIKLRPDYDEYIKGTNRNLAKQPGLVIIPAIDVPDEVEIVAEGDGKQIKIWLNGVEIEGVREINIHGLTYGQGPRVQIRALRTPIGGIQAETSWFFQRVKSFYIRALGVMDKE